MIERKQFIFALVRKPIRLFEHVPQTEADRDLDRDPDFADYTLEPGYYQLEEVENPYGFDHGSPWYVLTGTMTGIASDAWQAKSADPESGVTLHYRKTKHIYALVRGSQHTVYDSNQPKCKDPIALAPGYHELEIIPNPYGHLAPWFVLKGTNLGASCGSWRQWRKRSYNDFQLVVIYLREPLKKQRHQFAQPVAQATV